MTTIIKFDFKELRRLANDKNSHVTEKKITQELALPAWCLNNLKESIKAMLDYKIGKFGKDYNGILLNYKNLHVMQESTNSSTKGSGEVHFQIQADFYIFRPVIGAVLKGVVDKKHATHLVVIVHKVFNIVIARPTEEPGNKWIGSHYQEGQEIYFRIVMLDLYGALPYIRGEIVDEKNLKKGPEGDENEGLRAPSGNERTKLLPKQTGDGHPTPRGRVQDDRVSEGRQLKKRLHFK